jgi:hypothetical protein
MRIGSHSLGEFPLPVVRVDCERCNRAGSYRLAGLMARFGADAALPDVLLALASCERRADRGPVDVSVIICRYPARESPTSGPAERTRRAPVAQRLGLVDANREQAETLRRAIRAYSENETPETRNPPL